MSRKEIILFILIQLFFAATIFPGNDIMRGIITGGLLLCCILFNSFREKTGLLKERTYIVWMFLFFLWNFISIFFSTDMEKGFSYLNPRLPLFYFPLTIGLIKINTKFKERVLLGIALVVTAFCLVSLLRSVYYYIQSGSADNLYSDGLTFYADRPAIYIAALVNFSIYILCLFIFFRSYRFKAYLIPALVFLLVMSFLLASRNMLFVLCTLIAVFIVYYIIKKRQYLAGLTILIGIFMLGFFAIKFFPKTLNRFTDLNYREYNYSHIGTESNYSKATTPDQWNGVNFRLAAWRCGWEIFKEHPLAGTHLGNKKEKLIEKYKEKNFQFVIQSFKNVHNNYLDILFGTGIIGLFLFLTGWLIIPLRRFFIRKDYLSFIITATYAIAMITEVYFDRTFGGVFFGFFIPFLLSDGDK